MQTKDDVKQAVAHLTTQLDVHLIVYVDDLVDQSSFSSDEVLSRIIGQDVSNLRQYPQFADIPENLPDEVREEYIRRTWRGLPTEAQGELLRNLGVMNIDEDDYLREYFEDDDDPPNYLLLSPSAWDSQKEQVLSELKHGCVVVFFDEILGDGRRQGTELIKTLLNEVSDQHLICGLISHTFGIDEEYDEWMSRAENYDIDRDRFALISKRHFANNNYESFFNSLRRVLVNNVAKQIKAKMEIILANAFDKAKQRVQDINIFDFEHIVFASSLKEGVWEPDTLVRLFGIFQRREVLKRAREDEDLWKLVAKVRQVSLNHPPKFDTKKMSSLRIMQEEIYEEAEFLTQHHMPLELGDIFKKVSGTKLFVLIGQPCDLMVRTDGNRGHTVKSVIMAEIKIRQKPLKPHEFHSYFELPYYSDVTSNGSYYVHFRSFHSVPLSIVDLCVFSQNGQAMICLDESCPDGIIPSWKSRYDKLKEHFGQIFDTHQNIVNNQDCVSSKSVSKLFEPAPFLISIDNTSKTVSFNLERVRRLRQPRSSALLTSYASYLSRMAFEVDFGREILTSYQNQND